ncbi:MAG: 30S ribosomal protein S20 [Elusimicrobiota bacterium]
MAKLKTGRHTSTIREDRRSKRRLSHNLIIHGKIKTLAKKVEQAIAKKDAETALKYLKVVMSEWDKAAIKNIIPKQRASRKISRLSRRISRLSSAPAA